MRERGDGILEDIVMLLAIAVSIFFLVPYLPIIAHMWVVGIRVLWGAWLFFLSGGA